MTFRNFSSACALVLATSIVACGGDTPAQGQQAAGAGGAPGAGGGAAQRPQTAVEVSTAERGSIARQVTVAGVVEPVRSVAVNSQIAGMLTEVRVQEGDLVRRGTVVARVDATELAAQLAAAEANFEVARAALERSQQLRDRKVITLPEYERDRTAHAAAKAQLDQLRTRIGYASVAAPIAGVITEKHVEAGDVVSNNARLFTIADISQLVVRAGVSELDVVDLSQGDEVGITLDAMPARPLRGRIRRIFPSGDPTTRLVPVEVVLNAEDARAARPGFLARATFDLSQRSDVLLVPAAAVLGAQGSQSVFVVSDDNKASRRTVTTGLTSQGRVEVLSGLTAGDRVVTTGNNQLRDGMAVRIGSLGGPVPTENTGGTAAPAASNSAAPAQAPPATAPRN